MARRAVGAGRLARCHGLAARVAGRSREIVPLQSGRSVWRYGRSNRALLGMCPPRSRQSAAGGGPILPPAGPHQTGALQALAIRKCAGYIMGDPVSLEGAAYDRKTHPDHHRRTRYCGQRRRRCFDCGLGRECGHLLRRTRDFLGSAPKSVVLAVESLASSVGVDMLDAASQLQVGHAPPSVLLSRIAVTSAETRTQRAVERPPGCYTEPMKNWFLETAGSVVLALVGGCVFGGAHVTARGRAGNSPPERHSARG